MSTAIRKQVEKYDIDAEIGRDDLTIIYSGRRTSDNLPVVIRVIAPQFAFDDFFIERLRATVTRSMNLEHSNIVKVYEVGEKEDIVFIAREVVDGDTLADYIQEHGPLPIDQAINRLQHLASALDYAHKQGIRHGDLSDQTIFLSERDNQIWITDFGFLMAMDGTSLVRKGFASGNPAYLSPERVRGDGSSRLSDLYALGTVAYQMLTGEVPFKGEHASVLHAQAYEVPAVLSEINPKINTALSDAVLRMLSKGPEFRYRTGGEFVSALRAAAGNSSAMRRQLRQGQPAQDIVTKQILPWSKRFAFWMFIITPLMGLALAAGFWATTQWLSSPSVQQPAETVAVIPAPEEEDLTPVSLSDRLNISLDQPNVDQPVVAPTASIVESVADAIQSAIGTGDTSEDAPTPLPGVGGGNDQPVTGQATGVDTVSSETSNSDTIDNSGTSAAEPDDVTPAIVADGSPFTNLILSDGITDSYQPVNPTQTFVPTNQPIYLFFDYDNIQSGTAWTQIWRWGDVILQQSDDAWPEEYGSVGTAWIYFSPVEGFRAGPHAIELRVDDTVVATIEFVVNTEN
ncbi:MAG: serine/threonine-protein kinase [Chloroflexota bacterium]